MSRIAKVVFGVPMIYGHDGLKAFLLDHVKLDATKLAPGELVMCINRNEDKMKILGCNGLVLGYLRMPPGQKIIREALQYIPATFGGSGFSYDKAAQQALSKKLGVRETKQAPKKSKDLGKSSAQPNA